MPHARDNLCPHCGGKGFEWRKGHIIAHDGTHLADTYTQGPICTHCGGSGELPSLWFAAFMAIAVGLLVLAFILVPLGRAVFGG